jgi:predicted PurR-regulated permease PerM
VSEIRAVPVTTVGRDRLVRLMKGCVVLLLLGVLIFSRTIAVPALAAVLLSIALFPVVNRAAHLGLPRAIASILSLAALLGASAALLWAVHMPLAQLAARAPELVDAGYDFAARWTGQRNMRGEPGALLEMLTPLAAGIGSSLVAIGTSLILCHFILTCGTSVGRAALAAVRTRDRRRAWLRVCVSIRTQAAYYLQLVTLINLVFGVVTGLVLTVMGVEDAAAYGLIAGLMNFIPIVGAMITTLVIVAGGLAEHGASGVILLPAIVFLLLHIAESQFVTPLLLGRRLLLNPLIVIAGVLVGATAWGIGGAFLAVPILTSVKIALDAHPTLRPWGQVLGRGALAECDADDRRRARLRRATWRRRVTLKA